MLNNLERLIQLAEEVFSARTDPDQLDVDEEVLNSLKNIHPASVSELDVGQGPIAWVLVIPTTTEIMTQFLHRKMSEKDILDLTPEGGTYDTLYLCSALVLEEYRQKGIAKELCIKAIEKICVDHPLKALFVWSFTKEGEQLADKVAKQVGLPIFKRTEIHK